MKRKINKKSLTMKKLNVEILQTQKGITLLILVITIIVLLILAGITIGAITGDESTIVNASKAKFKTEIKDIEEKIELEEINNNDGEDFQFGTLKDLIGREDGYNEILYMEDGKLVYIEDKVSNKQAQWLEEMDIQAKQNIIPIYTGEQFKKIGTGEEIEIEEAGGEKFQFNIDSHYVLQNDINLNCSEENQWKPLGATNEFKGILDGKNYNVSGIYINSNEEYIGLFAYNNGTIENIVLSNGYIKGLDYVSGIVARNNTSGKIINCVNKVEVNNITGNYSGGIVSDNRGLIENCENNSYLDFRAIAGGISGGNSSSGLIKNCKNTHEILLRDFTIGGIVGQNEGTVEECYNIGNILPDTNYARYGKGGIVGTNNGDIKKCYNLANVQGNSSNWNVGGISGVNGSNGNIEFSYNIGNISGRTSIGGIVGANEGKTRYCYTIENIEMTGSNTGTLDNCLKLTEKQMKGQEKITLEDGTMISFIELLNKEENCFVEDTKNINKGYPIFQ